MSTVSTVVVASSAGLCAVVCVQTWILQTLLRDVSRLAQRRKRDRSALSFNQLQGALNNAVPEFFLKEVDSDASITEQDLVGQFSIFLFVTRADVVRAGKDAFASSVDGLFAHSDDHLYVVCEGSENDARWIRDDVYLAQRYRGHVKVLVARNSTFRMQLGLGLTPSSAMIDEDAKVAKVGQPVFAAQH